MLLFIFAATSPSNLFLIFQYISCYCLSAERRNGRNRCMISIHLMLLFIIEPLLRMCMYMYFNTSHVTVYHYPGFFCSALRKFQYISCYCLSQGNTVKEGANKKFQYISCYCLSPSHWEWPPGVWISIHLMLLFINQDHHTFLQYQDFNTSHVTVYRIRTVWVWKHNGISIHLMLLFITTSYLYITLQIIISIHLMLLFIGFALYESGNTMVFQYISCYCLSLYQHSWMCLHQDFNTSHVTVYQGYHKAGKEVWDISIHLMLLFITPGQASAIRLIYISIHLMLLFIFSLIALL